MKRKDENEGRLAHYERRKTKKACALRKDEQGLRLTKERKDENEKGLRITKDEGRLAQYEGRRTKTKEGLRLTKDEERKHEGGWRAGVIAVYLFLSVVISYFRNVVIRIS